MHKVASVESKVTPSEDDLLFAVFLPLNMRSNLAKLMPFPSTLQYFFHFLLSKDALFSNKLFFDTSVVS